MQETSGATLQMLPLWFQWLFAIGGIVLIVAVFLALWTKLTRIDRRIARLEDREGPPAG